MKTNIYQLLARPAKALSLFGALTFGGLVQAQTVYTFTNCNATGQNGPSQAQVNSAYASTTLDGEVTSSSGIQLWTVPSTGNYKIEAYGAQGGTQGGYAGGKGAYISGKFLLTGGSQIKVLVGQAGVTGGASASGGGGGSFVVLASGNVPLVVAGGGSGATGGSAGKPGVTTTAGTAGDNCSGNGGTGGNGGGSSASCGSGTGGGGGLLSNGQETGSWGYQRGMGFLQGGQGGPSGYGGSVGGFGGGAGTHTNNTGGAPGGGYSGGGAPYHGNGYSGGGGGSYNDGDDQVNTADYQSGHGLVVITQLSLPVPNEIGAAQIVSPAEGSCAGTYPLEVLISNYGNNQVTTATINWTINGGTTFTQSFSGLLDTNNGSLSTEALVNLGNVTISGNVDIKVWTSLPNGQNDTVNFDDTTQLAWYASDPQINLDNVALCNGAFEIVNVYDPQWASYLWDDNSTAPARLINTPGTYAITATDTFGCPAMDAATVAAGVTPVVNMGGEIEACGEVMLNSGTANGTYVWSNGATTQTIIVTESGSYIVTVTSEHGCVGEGGVKVTIHESPEVDLGVDKSICGDKDEVAVLNTGGGFASYVWSTGQSDSYILVNGQQGHGTSKEFSVTVTDENGCTAADTIRVSIKQCIPTGLAAIPDSDVLNVYPNPATTALTVDLPAGATTAAIELADLTGRVLRKEVHTGNIVTLDLKGLAPGQYFVRVQTEGETQVKPFVIQY